MANLLPIVLGTSIVDSINPFAIGALLLLLATATEAGIKFRKIILMGFAYIAAIFVTYFSIGTGLLEVLLVSDFTKYFLAFISAAVVFIGIDQMLEYWDVDIIKTSMSTDDPRVEKFIKKTKITSSAALGSVVALLELPATGGPYFAITALLASESFTLSSIALLVLYNAIVILPLVGILLAVKLGVDVEKANEWRERREEEVGLFTGLFMIALGIGLFIWAV